MKFRKLAKKIRIRLTVSTTINGLIQIVLHSTILISLLLKPRDYLRCILCSFIVQLNTFQPNVDTDKIRLLE